MYGATVEWYRGAWAARGGLFDLSNVPNSADAGFHQIQIVSELEHEHTWHGQPGKVALVGFLSRGRMSRYDDASRWRSTPKVRQTSQTFVGTTAARAST
jgi:high affinity Mn2+ porin